MRAWSTYSKIRVQQSSRQQRNVARLRKRPRSYINSRATAHSWGHTSHVQWTHAPEPNHFRLLVAQSLQSLALLFELLLLSTCAREGKQTKERERERERDAWLRDESGREKQSSSAPPKAPAAAPNGKANKLHPGIVVRKGGVPFSTIQVLCLRAAPCETGGSGRRCWRST